MKKVGSGINHVEYTMGELRVVALREGIVISKSEPVLGGIAAPEPIYVNMGINSGSALVGMTRFKGSLSTRMTYTASGRVTNIAGSALRSGQEGGYPHW